MISANDSDPLKDGAAEAHAGASDGSARRQRFIAVGLSLFIPGAGHISAGRIGAAAFWMAASFAGYAQMLACGLVVHALCVVATARITPVHPPAGARSSS